MSVVLFFSSSFLQVPRPQKTTKTRLHSSRMHTARLLTVYPSMHCTGRGVCACPGGGCAPRRGSQHALRQTPLLWTEFLTHASENITLPQTSFAGGNNGNLSEIDGFLLGNFGSLLNFLDGSQTSEYIWKRITVHDRERVQWSGGSSHHNTQWTAAKETISGISGLCRDTWEYGHSTNASLGSYPCVLWHRYFF